MCDDLDCHVCGCGDDCDEPPVLLCAEADPPAGDDEPPGFFCPGCAEVARACVCGGGG